MLGSRRWHRVALSLFASATVLYIACSGPEGPTLPPCVSVSDCPSQHRCINNVCVPPGVDAGGRHDSGTFDSGTPRDSGSDASEAFDAFIPTDAPSSGTIP